MSNINSVLSALSQGELVALVATLLEGQVTQAPTTPAKAEPKVDTRPACGRTKSSDGEPCTRKATQADGACKSHTGDWDNTEALARFAKAQEFVDSRREAAIAKGKSPKVDNKALAAALRAVGVTPNGEAWAKAKALVASGQSVEAAAAVVSA